MTNQDYWQTLVGDQSPEDFLRTYGTADPDVGLERFLEDRGHFCGVLNQGNWIDTFGAENQYQVLTAQIYLRSYLEETREEWQALLEAKPPKVVRRYRPVYDLPASDSTESDSPEHDAENPPDHGEAPVVLDEVDDGEAGVTAELTVEGESDGAEAASDLVEVDTETLIAHETDGDLPTENVDVVALPAADDVELTDADDAPEAESKADLDTP